MFMTGLVDEDNSDGMDEFHDIEKNMFCEKGDKKILSGLKDACRVALVVAFANMVGADGSKEESD